MQPHSEGWCCQVSKKKLGNNYHKDCLGTLVNNSLLIWQVFILNSGYCFDEGVCASVSVCVYAWVQGASSRGNWVVMWLLFGALCQQHCWYFWDKASHIIIKCQPWLLMPVLVLERVWVFVTVTFLVTLKKTLMKKVRKMC